MDALPHHADIVILALTQSIRSLDIDPFFAFCVLVLTVGEDLVLASNRDVCWWERYSFGGHPRVEGPAGCGGLSLELGLERLV